MKNLICLVVVTYLSFTHASAQTAVYNFDFEDWYKDGSGQDRLDLWEHIDKNGNNWLQLHGTQKSTHSYSGSYAVTVHRWYMVSNDGLKIKSSISQKPGYLNGFYKYTDVVLKTHPDRVLSDTATITLYFTKWNNVSGRADTIGYSHQELSASSGYVPFSCPITYINADQPDSFYIYIQPSKYSFGFMCKDSSDCSFLTVDNLSFSNTTGFSNTSQEKKTVRIYPNPANELIILEGVPSTLAVKIYTSSGAFQSKQKVKDGKVNVAHLSPGLYWIIGQDSDKLWRGSFMKQ